MTSSAIRIADVADIHYRYEPHQWRFAVDEAVAIDAHWRKLVTANPRYFNGRVLMMHRYALQQHPSGLLLDGACFETEYKAFLAWRNFGFPDPEVHNCFAMPALRSIDGAFILGEMAPFTASPGRIYFPAGTPEPNDLAGPVVDLTGNMLRELEEETGLGGADVTFLPGWTVVFAGPRIACMKIAQSPLPAAAILDRVGDFLQRETEPELARVVAVSSPADFDEERMPDFTLAYLRHVLA